MKRTYYRHPSAQLEEALIRAQELDYDLIGRHAVVPSKDPSEKWMDKIPIASLHAVANAYEKAGRPDVASRYRARIQRRHRDPGKPDSRRKVHSSHIRELRPRSHAPRGIERPIGAGYILAVYPYPFGKRAVAWHVYHVRNPNEWYSAGEADSFDDAIDTANRKFGVNPRALAARDPRRSNRPRPNAKQRVFIAKKIPLLIDEGYPQRQAIAIAYRMAGVPPLVRSSTTRTSRRKRPTRKSRRDVSRETRPSGHVRGGVRMCPCPEQRPPRMITFDPEDPFFGRDPLRRRADSRRDPKERRFRWRVTFLDYGGTGAWRSVLINHGAGPVAAPDERSAIRLAARKHPDSELLQPWNDRIKVTREYLE